MTTNLPIKLEHLPSSLPLDGAVRIELVEGVLIFRASTTVIERIETLRSRSYESSLTTDEEADELRQIIQEALILLKYNKLN